MKKNIISKSFLTTLIAVMLITPAVAQTADDYSENSTEIKTEENKADSYTEGSVDLTTKKTNKKKIHNPFEGMFTSKQTTYNYYDTIGLSTGTIGTAIKHRDAEVFVDPKSEKAGLLTNYQSAYFDFLFDTKNIVLIADCYEKYLKDFEEHKLIKNKYLKTRRMYTEKGKCRVEWGTVRGMMNNYGDARFHVGYEFKNNSPYFCIIIKDTENIAPDLGTFVADKSVEVQLYFTKAEAQRFLEVLGRDRVSKELNKNVFVEDEY